MIKEKDQIKVVCKGGGSIISLPPVFSHDAQCLFVSKSHNIITYNVSTGNKLMELPKTQNEIVGFGVSFLNDSEHVIVCTKDGDITLWKSNTGLKLRRFKTDFKKIKFFKTFSVLDDDNNQITKALVCYENKKKKRYSIIILNLLTDDHEVINIKLKIEENVFIDVAEDGKFIAVAQDNVLYYYQLHTNSLRRHFIKDRIFTYVRCHPTEEVLLTGDNTGRVLIWNNLLKKSPTKTVYHWHTLPVKSASFSKSGTQFYSGGSECVLVRWILNDSHKNFLPRLPGFIEHVSVAPENLYVAVSTSDNAIQIITPQMKLKNTIQHMVIGNDVSTDVTFDPRSKSLVFNGTSGHVQFFSPRDLDLIYSLDVTDQNKYTNERDTILSNTIISHLAIEKTGSWMATVEERIDSQMVESRLKFWFYDTSSQRFSLNTSIEYPHEKTIKKLTFQPSNSENELHCVTVGDDKKFKIWQLVPIKTVHREGVVWECSSAVSYRDLSPNVSSFSGDGSLLAVGFESIVTAWLPETCELKCSLRHPIQQDNLCHISFGADSQCHLLLSATKTFLTVWNMLTLSIDWTVAIDVQYVVSDINCSFKCVFTEDKKLYIFELNSSHPVYVKRKLTGIKSNIHSATFVPRKGIASDLNINWAERFFIYILTTDFEIFAIETAETEPIEAKLHIKEDQSFFRKMVPEVRNALRKDQTQIHCYAKDVRGKKLQQLLNTPVPSLQLSFLCEDILGDSLVQKDKVNTMDVHDTNYKENNHKITVKGKFDVNKLFDNDLDLESVVKEKMQWTSVLL